MESNIYEVRVDGERQFGPSDLALAREMFWFFVDESAGCTVELAEPQGVVDFVDEAGR